MHIPNTSDRVTLIEMDVGDSAAIAAKTLGYETLKDLRRSVIVSFVNGNDVFCCTSGFLTSYSIISKYDSWAQEWLGYSH